MNLSLIKNAMTLKSGRALLELQKNAPNILFVGGVVGVVGAAVLASRATLRLDETLSNIETEKNRIIGHSTLPTYSEKDRKHDLALVRIDGIKQVAVLYAPSVIVGTLSIVALTRSHQILLQRNTAVMAAYAALDKGFKQYRSRVIEELGDEKDQEFRYGTTTHTEMMVDDDGNATSVEHKLLNPDLPSGYARFFDEFSQNWSPEPEYNHLFLNAQQKYANDRLKARGHVFLNEVYDDLDLPRTKAGAIVGWVYDEEGDGDNFIDFGIYSGSERSRAFVNGPEKSILLDFNVDGIIYHLIGKGEMELGE